jgi:hypothetical protein
MTTWQLWTEFLIGYLFSIAVETPVLLVGLSPRHTWRRRLFAGMWLTACTYPVVFFVLPVFLQQRTTYLLVAETFAPVTECVLFALLFVGTRHVERMSVIRDWTTIALANLASFTLGKLLLS